MRTVKLRSVQRKRVTKILVQFEITSGELFESPSDEINNGSYIINWPHALLRGSSPENNYVSLD